MESFGAKIVILPIDIIEKRIDNRMARSNGRDEKAPVRRPLLFREVILDMLDSFDQVAQMHVRLKICLRSFDIFSRRRRLRLVDDDFDEVDDFLHLLAGSIDNRRSMVE